MWISTKTDMNDLTWDSEFNKVIKILIFFSYIKGIRFQSQIKAFSLKFQFCEPIKII